MTPSLTAAKVVLLLLLMGDVVGSGVTNTSMCRHRAWQLRHPSMSVRATQALEEREEWANIGVGI